LLLRPLGHHNPNIPVPTHPSAGRRHHALDWRSKTLIAEAALVPPGPPPQATLLDSCVNPHIMLCNYCFALHNVDAETYTMKATYSLSFELETGDKTAPELAARLNRQLAGQIRDLIAAALSGLDFGLRENYCLLMPERAAVPPRLPDAASIPVWSAEAHSFVDITIGSPEWFEMVERESKFSYRYQGQSFRVRQETRTVKGKQYTYWRAYATVDGKLVTRQLGKTKDLTKEALDEVGEYFAGQRAERE
jgi:hypothetical protein